MDSYSLTATNCCVCRRPLVDAKSVELGIGPICRQKHGFDVDIPEEARTEANKIVHAVACAITAEQRARLEALGMDRLAARIAKRLQTVRPAAKKGTVTITKLYNGWSVKAPYNAESLPAWRRVGRWNAKNKTREVPCYQKVALWALLQEFYEGHTLISEKGETVIGAAPAAPRYADALERALRRKFSASIDNHEETR